MEIRKIPYTDKYPYMYQVILHNVIIQTTQEDKFNKLVEMLDPSVDNYFTIPANKRLQIEIAFEVRHTQ